MNSERYPRVIIQYCSKCNWQNRAIWYLSELLQTFEGVIHDISLQPIIDQPGAFQVLLQKSSDSVAIVYKRRFKSKDLALKYGDVDGTQSESYYYDGFPDSKLLKVLIRDLLENKNINLGHVDRYTNSSFLNSSKHPDKETEKVVVESTAKKSVADCKDCEKE